MTTRGDLYALLIGINDYDCDAVRKLTFAVADVLAFREFLADRLHLDDRNSITLSHPVSGSGQVPRRAAADFAPSGLRDGRPAHPTPIRLILANGDAAI